MRVCNKQKAAEKHSFGVFSVCVFSGSNDVHHGSNVITLESILYILNQFIICIYNIYLIFTSFGPLSVKKYVIFCMLGDFFFFSSEVMHICSLMYSSSFSLDY